MPCLAGERTNEVFLDDVFVPDDYVVGELNKGFYYVSEALDFERFTLFTISAFARKYEALRDVPAHRDPGRQADARRP